MIAAIIEAGGKPKMMIYPGVGHNSWSANLRQSRGNRMAIRSEEITRFELRCRQCGKLLRTSSDTEKRQTQCPECGTICTVADSVELDRSSARPLPTQLACDPSSPATGSCRRREFREPASVAPRRGIWKGSG